MLWHSTTNSQNNARKFKHHTYLCTRLLTREELSEKIARIRAYTLHVICTVTDSTSIGTQAIVYARCQIWRRQENTCTKKKGRNSCRHCWVNELLLLILLLCLNSNSAPHRLRMAIGLVIARSIVLTPRIRTRSRYLRSASAWSASWLGAWEAWEASAWEAS